MINFTTRPGKLKSVNISRAKIRAAGVVRGLHTGSPKAGRVASFCMETKIWGKAMIENVKEKIKKLLALSKSSNEFEAAQALAFALKIARKYNIDLEEIKTEKKIAEEDAIYKASLSQWECYLFGGIAREFGCRILLGHAVQSGKLKRRIIMVGQEQNRAMATYLATYLHRTIKNLWKKEKKQLKNKWCLSEYRIREDYCLGMVYSVLKKTKEMLCSAADYSDAANALIVSKGTEVDLYIAEQGIKTARSRTANISGAVYDGMRSGKSVAIHRPLESSSCPVKQIR